MTMLSAFFVAALAVASSTAMPKRDADPLPEVATKLGLTDLVKDVAKAGLKDTLESAGPFTLFGPTNKAFHKLPDWAKKAMKNVTVLAKVLKYHVIPGKFYSKVARNEHQFDTLQGEKLRINIYDVHNATVATAQCTPIDIYQLNKEASNGLIHVLNGVMIPPGGNINVILGDQSIFSTLVKAVKVAGLVSTLSGPGPLTLFAPTDEAFAKLPHGTLEKLWKEPEKLAELLKYHVVSGTLCSPGLSSINVKTEQGQDIYIKVSKDGIVVNASKVISPDGSVTNGVIHGIDTVLLPPGF